MSIDKLKSKFFNGSFINDVKHYFSKINEIIDYLNDNPISGGGLSGLTTNKVLKATSSTTAGDSSITDDGTTVTFGNDVKLNGTNKRIYTPNGNSFFKANDTNIGFEFVGTTNTSEIASNDTENTFYHDAQNTFDAPLHEFNNSVTKNGVEVATVNDILGGATGSFTTNDGKTITVTNGRITAIV